MEKYQMKIIPNPTIPGEMLTEEFLIPLNISRKELATRTGLSLYAINEICEGERAISSLTAARLADVFDNTPEFWINLQAAWDLYKR